MSIEYRELPLTEPVLSQLISLSQDWEEEDNCRGYRKNSREDIEGNRIFTALRGEEIVGYLFGKVEKTDKPSTVLPQGSEYFEVEELYVTPQFRSNGIGSRLFSLAEDRLRRENVSCIMLTTATKNWKAIFHFYVEEVGMEFWHARLFKLL